MGYFSKESRQARKYESLAHSLGIIQSEIEHRLNTLEDNYSSIKRDYITRDLNGDALDAYIRRSDEYLDGVKRFIDAYKQGISQIQSAINSAKRIARDWREKDRLNSIKD